MKKEDFNRIIRWQTVFDKKIDLTFWVSVNLKRYNSYEYPKMVMGPFILFARPRLSPLRKGNKEIEYFTDSPEWDVLRGDEKKAILDLKNRFLGLVQLRLDWENEYPYGLEFNWPYEEHYFDNDKTHPHGTWKEVEARFIKSWGET